MNKQLLKLFHLRTSKRAGLSSHLLHLIIGYVKYISANKLGIIHI